MKIVYTTALAIGLFLGWSDWAVARDTLVTECGTVYPQPKPLPNVRVKF
jgi:hypothetical protein